MFPRDRLAWPLRLGLVAIFLTYSAAGLAKTTGVDDDAALQSGPCYQALVDRNVSQPTTAPNRELGAACDAEHGDAEKAWARVVRLWGSDSADVPDYDSYVRADAGASPSAVWKGLGLLGVLLVYALCGVPMRSLAGLMTTGSAGATLRSAGATAVNLILRGFLGLILLWLSGLPYLTLAGGLAFAVIIVRELRGSAANATLRRRDGATNEAGGFAILTADAINDVLGAAPGLVGIALLAQHDGLWLAVAVALAVVASLPPVILLRRRLRASPLAVTIAGAILAAGIGALAQQDSSIAAMVGHGGILSIVAPLAFALAVLASGWRNSGSVRGLLKPEARTRI